MPDESIPDLWPDELIPRPVRTPVAILRAQAAALSKRMNNIIEGEINSSGLKGEFIHEFVIVAPSLQYRYVLFRVVHGIALYPIRVAEPNAAKLQNEAAFLDWMRGIFASKKTQHILSALIAQSTESMPLTAGGGGVR